MIFYVAVLTIFAGILSTGNSQGGPPGVNDRQNYPAPPQPGPPGSNFPYVPGPPGMNLDESRLQYPSIPHDAGIPEIIDGNQGGAILDNTNHIYSDPRGPTYYDGVPINELRWRDIMERRRRLSARTKQ